MKTAHKTANKPQNKQVKPGIAIASIILIMALGFLILTISVSAATNTSETTTAIVIQNTIQNPSLNTDTNKTNNDSNIIPTRAINPIIDTFSNVTTTATYRLPSKNATKVDCRMICPINCNYRNQAYFNTIEDTVLITARYTLNFTGNKSFDFFATTHPAFQKCSYSYGLSRYTPFTFRLESQDRLTIYYKNITRTMTFSNTNIYGTNIDIEQLNKSIYIRTNETGRANMLDNETDIEFGILSIAENEEKYRKTIIRDFYINISISKTGFVPIKEEPIIIVEKNTTQPIQKEDPIKSGNLKIAAKSTVERPVSFIVGSIIIGLIVIIGIGLYYGYKKMDW